MNDVILLAGVEALNNVCILGGRSFDVARWHCRRGRVRFMKPSQKRFLVLYSL